MKFKGLLTAIITVAIILSLGMSAAASATPVYGGKAVFTASDFELDYDSVNGNGAFKAYRIDMSTVTIDGKKAVKLTAQNEAKQGLIDFSWYQYNNSEYLPALNTNDYGFLKISYKRAAPTTADFTFYKATEDVLGKGGTNANYPFKADSTEWATVIIDLKAQASLKWTEKNIRQFRLYPWGMKNADGFAGETIYIEYVGFFKTEAEAKAYDPAKPAAQSDKKTAPTTVDPIITALAMAVAAGAVIVKKNH